MSFRCHPDPERCEGEGSGPGAPWPDPSAAPQDDGGYEPVAEDSALPERGLLSVRLSNGIPVCLYRLHGEIGALHDNCTHADFPMSDGELRADGTIECVWHGARFDCRSGAVCRGPADEPLPVYDVKVEGGKIHVALRRAAR